MDGGIFTGQFGSGLHYLANETFFVGAGIYLDPNKVSLGFADAKEIITLSGAVSSWLGSNSEINPVKQSTRYTYRFHVRLSEHNNIAETLP